MTIKRKTLLCSALLTMLVTGFANAQATIELAFGHISFDYTPLFKQFERETGHQILSAPATDYDLKAELVKRRRKKQLPDVFIAPADYATIPSLSLVHPDKTWFDANLSEKSIQTVASDGKHLGVPLVLGNHLLLYYNKSIVPQPAKSFAQLAEQKPTLPGNARLISWSYHVMYSFIPFLSAFDAMPIQNMELTLDGPGMSQALEYYWSLPDLGLAQPNCDTECYPDYFAQGQFAYVIDGIWSLQKYQSALGDDLGIALLPSINEKPMRPYFSSHIFAILEKERSAEELAAIRQLALFLQSEYSQKWLWENERALPTNQRVLNAILSSGDPNMRAIVLQLDQAESLPLSPYMAVMWEALSKGFNRYGAGMLTAEQSAILMQHLAKRTMERQQWQ